MTLVTRLRRRLARHPAVFRAARLALRAYHRVRGVALRVESAVIWRLPDRRFYGVKYRYLWRYWQSYSREQYLSVRRHLSDVPRAPESRPRLALVVRASTGHFLDPLVPVLSEHYELYYYPAHSRALFRDARHMDAIWVEWGTGAYLLEELARCKGRQTKLLCRVHDHEVREGPHAAAAPWGAADHLLFINRDAAAELDARTRGAHRSRQLFAANGVDERGFARADPAPEARVLLLSEGYTPRKGYTRAVELFARARVRAPELHLYIKADPDHEGGAPGPVLEAVRANGLEEAVTLLVPSGDPLLRKRSLPVKTEVAQVYQSMGCILSTSEHEGFHYAVAEGMLSGLYPIVWSWAWGRPRDFWEPYVVGDEEELVERLVAWSRLGPEERARLGREARDYCVARYGREATRRTLAAALPALARPASPPRKRRLVLFAHNHLYRYAPHGGEKSMARIVEDLGEHGYETLVVVANRKNKEHSRESFAGVPVISVPHEEFRAAAIDVLRWWHPSAALVWELPAREIWDICASKGIPYQLFIRYWHLVNPPPYDDLLTDAIDTEHQRAVRPVFENAASVIVNARHVQRVLARFFQVASEVAYVPVAKRARLSPASRKRFVTVVNARKSHGGALLRALAERMPAERFLVIDANTGEDYPGNVTCRGYSSGGYERMLDDTRILLFPFDTEPCGTGRVVQEAYNLGVPVVAPARGGLPEWIPAEHLVSDNDDVDQWRRKLAELSRDYDAAVHRVTEIAAAYDEGRELGVVRRELERIIALEQPPAKRSFGKPVDEAYRLARPGEETAVTRTVAGFGLMPATRPY